MDLAAVTMAVEAASACFCRSSSLSHRDWLGAGSRLDKAIPAMAILAAKSYLKQDPVKQAGTKQQRLTKSTQRQQGHRFGLVQSSVRWDPAPVVVTSISDKGGAPGR